MLNFNTGLALTQPRKTVIGQNRNTKKEEEDSRGGMKTFSRRATNKWETKNRQFGKITEPQRKWFAGQSVEEDIVSFLYISKNKSELGKEDRYLYYYLGYHQLFDLENLPTLQLFFSQTK